MKTIILITNSFPFGIAEKSFIAPEFDILKEKFQFVIVARNTTEEQTSQIPDGTPVYRYDANQNYRALQLLICALLRGDLYREWFRCVRAKKMNAKQALRILKIMMRSLHFENYLNNVRKDCKEESVLFYTYWNDFATYASTRVKRKSDKIVSRIHGADLYLERSDGWQPYKQSMNQKVAAIYFISENGRQYYQKNYEAEQEKLRLCYMGVSKSLEITPYKEKDEIRLVSVSRCVEVKRLSLLIRLLAQIKDMKVSWVHIGTGEQFEELKEQAEYELSHCENIRYEWKGYMENAQMRDYLARESFDFLINVSSSEGLPVSIMEAMACATPVIATDVGGTREIVADGENGFLIPKDFSVEQVIKILKHYQNSLLADKMTMRQNAYQTWEEKFSQDDNYNKFAKELEQL